MTNAAGLLLSSLIMVLEQASFLYPTSPLLKDFEPYKPGKVYESGDKLFLATVDSDNSLVCLWIPRGLGAIIAANMLGTEPDDPYVQDRIMDAIGEMTNMVAGLLVNSDEKNSKIEMTVPSFYEPDCLQGLACQEGLTLTGAVSFFVEEHRMSGAVFQKHTCVGLQ